MSRPPCRLAALGQVSALGRDRSEIHARLVAGDSGLSLRDDFVRDRSLWLGAVRDPLPAIPGALARFACRNNQLALAALESIGAEVAAAISRFGAERVGVVVGTSTSGVGEAGVLLLVTGESGGVQLLGVGDSGEAHHMSAPDPEGRGAEVAMKMALDDAGLAPGEIAYLNLHGTGTPQNDVMEAAAVARVLGTDVPCSSTKPLVGHTLGAAGALEAAFCWLVLAERSGGRLALPPHVWDGAREPA